MKTGGKICLIEQGNTVTLKRKITDMTFDIPTANLIVGLMYFLFPLTVFVFLKEHRTLPVILWCLGGFLNGFGFVAIGMRMHYPEASGVITYTLPNVLLFIGVLIRIHSLKLECKSELKPMQLIAFTLTFAVAYEIVRINLGSDFGRVVFLLPIFAIEAAYMAYTSALYERLFKTKLIRTITYNYALYSFLLMSKVVLSLSGFDDGTIMANNVINIALSFIAMVTVVYTNLGYIGVVLERVNIERKESLHLNNQLSKSLKKREATIKSFVRLKAFSALGGQGTAVVHEIMQPLTAMRFALENLTRYFEKQGAPSEVFERINAAKEPMERSIKVVQNLRNLMVENNVDIKAVNLHEKISDCLIILRDRIDDLQIHVNIDSSNREILIIADNNQFQHVLLNVLTNAIEAIERHALGDNERKIVVQMAYTDQKRYVTVNIIDTGPGIPEKIREHLFEWLSTGTKKGMGVGLALCKHFIESWGGSISADNADVTKTGLTGAVIQLKLRAA